MADTEAITRRTVLKTTAAAAGVAAGGAGVALAFSAGDCVVATRDTSAYLNACPESGFLGTVSEGSEGVVQSTCGSTTEEWALVAWNDFPESWVDTADLDLC